MSFVKISLICTLCFFTACSTMPGSSGSFKLKSYKEKTLKNGLKVLIIPDHSLPRVTLSLMVKAGSLDDPKGKEGLNALVVNSFDGGTASISATQLADEFAQLGTELALSPGSDFSQASVSALSVHKEKVLGLFADIVTGPAFLPKEIDRQKSQTVSAIVKAVDSPSSYADELFDRQIYGDHPYGHRVIGEISSVQKLTKTDLIRHYFRYYRPNNAILAVTGDVDNAFLQQVDKVFLSWQEAKVEPAQVSPIEEKKAQAIRLFSKNDLKQAQIRMGELGIKRNDPDYFLLRMANVIFGGGFSSRLNQKIRDDLGLTYSISSSSQAMLDRGTLGVETFTRNDKVAETIKQINIQLKSFVESGVTKDELEAAKALMIGQFPSAIETVDALGFNLMVLRRYGISDDYLKNYVRRVSAITVKEVNAAIKRHYDINSWQTVVFADQKATLSLLKQLGQVEVISVK